MDYNLRRELLSQSDYESESESSTDPGESETSSSSTHPKDRYNFVLITFFLLGTGTLLPWNFFITANDYWMYKFRNLSSNYDPNQKSPLQSAFVSYLSITNYLPFIILLFLNVVFSHKIRENKRIGGSLLVMILVFSATTALVKINTEHWQKEFFLVTMSFVFLISVACAVFQGGVGGSASLLPVKYMHSVMSGQAVAGIFAAVAQIISLARNNHHPTDSALGYFTCAILFLLFVSISYSCIQRSPFYQYFLLRKVDQEEKPPMLENLPTNSITVVCLILKKTWIHGLTVLLVFWVTLSVFPAICVLVVPQNYTRSSSLNGVYFLPVCCFLLFNLSDLTGRTISKWIPLRRSWKWQLLALSFLRVIYLPLFMFCNCKPRHRLPVLFGDVAYVVLIVTMGLTNGYLATIAMMFGPLNTKREFREMAGFVLVALMGTGLTLGAITSYPLLKLL